MMETAYTALASAVFALHLVFILAVAPSTAALCCGYYRTRPLFFLAHCICVYSMALAQLLLRACPLVPLEHMLREAGGGAPWYSGSFILFVVERLTGLHLPVALIASLSILVIVLTTAALLEARLRVAGGDMGAAAAQQ
ncbi:MAG: DUF2784 family protein [Chloroflexi bacterium]|nr:DUF2784 family protein [Chloroflexota bacterium]MCI0890239.1 DUF2784 family protein [Chloroflexota bacterium]